MIYYLRRLIIHKFVRQTNDFNNKVSIVQKDVQDIKRHLENAHAEAIGKVQEATTKIISELAGKYNIDKYGCK